jgi:hypothetical protein
MYNGKYLTNNGGGNPVFQAEQDNIRPQRQEWKITVDPSTDRHKIINLEDNRYVNENGSFTVNNATNPYEAVWHTYEIIQLANGKYAIKNGGKAGDKYWKVNGTRIENSNSNEPLPAQFIFDIVPLGGEIQGNLLESDEVYYILDGDKLLTNGNGGTPTFQSIDEPGVAQEWKIAIDTNGKNCYKITSNADGRYLNEYGVFGTNAYYSDWNTYLITAMGDNYSMQWTQSAVKNGKQTFIIVSGNRLEAKEVARSESYTVKIIAKEDYTSVKNIYRKTMSYNGTQIVADNARRITIYSIDGRTIKKSDGNVISTARLVRGIYIAIAENENRTETLRFIIE